MIFVDTGAWIALTDESDQYHIESIHIYKKLKEQNEKFITTDYIINETVTRLRYDSNHQIAIKFLELIAISRNSGTLKIIYIDELLFEDAIFIFSIYDTAVLSFTDCASFAVCKKYRIHKAFAFDRHFTMMGITLCLA